MAKIEAGQLLYSPRWSEAEEPAAEMGDFKRGLSQSGSELIGTGAGLIGLVGDAVGSDRMKQYGLDRAQAAFDRSAALGKETDRLEGINSFGDAIDYLQHGAGYVLGQAVPSIVTGGIGGAVGKAAAQKGAKAAIEAEAKRAIINRGIQTGAITGTGAASYGQAAGSLYPEMVSEGHDDAGRAALYALPIAAIDVLPEARAIRKLVGPGVADAAQRGLTRTVGKEVGKQALLEGGAEALQTPIERMASYKELTGAEATSDYLNSAALGLLGGGMLGGVSGVVDYASRPRVDPGNRDTQNLLGGANTPVVEGQGRVAGYPADQSTVGPAEPFVGPRQPFVGPPAPPTANEFVGPQQPFVGPQRPIEGPPAAVDRPLEVGPPAPMVGPQQPFVGPQPAEPFVGPAVPAIRQRPVDPLEGPTQPILTSDRPAPTPATQPIISPTRQPLEVMARTAYAKQQRGELLTAFERSLLEDANLTANLAVEPARGRATPTQAELLQDTPLRSARDIANTTPAAAPSPGVRGPQPAQGEIFNPDGSPTYGAAQAELDYDEMARVSLAQAKTKPTPERLSLAAQIERMADTGQISQAEYDRAYTLLTGGKRDLATATQLLLEAATRETAPQAPVQKPAPKTSKRAKSSAPLNADLSTGILTTQRPVNYDTDTLLRNAEDGDGALTVDDAEYQLYRKWSEDGDPKAEQYFTDNKVPPSRIAELQARYQNETRTVLRSSLKDGDAKANPNDPKVAQRFENGNAALKWLAENGSTSWVRFLAERLAPFVGTDVVVRYVKDGDAVPSNLAGALANAHGIAVLSPDGKTEVYLRTDSALGQNESTLIHELLHAATLGRLESNPRLRTALDSLAEKVRASLRAALDAPEMVNASETQRAHFSFLLNALKDGDELLAYTFTSPDFRVVAKHIAADGSWANAQRGTNSVTLPKANILQRFADWVRGLFGIAKVHTATVEKAIDTNPAAAPRSFKTLHEAVENLFNQIMEADINPAGLSDGPRVQQSVATVAQAQQVTRALGDMISDVIGSKLKRVGRGVAFLRDLADANAKTFMSNGKSLLHAYVDTAFAMAAKSNVMLKTAGDISEAWGRLDKATSAQLSSLMADATLAEIHPDVPLSHERNKHMADADGNFSPEVKAKHAQLQREFQALPKPAKEVYARARTQLAENWKLRGDLLNKTVDAVFEPLIKRANERGDTVALASLRRERDNYIKEYGRVLSQVRGPYFPLMRFGDNYVTYKSESYRATEGEVASLREQLSELYERYEPLAASRREKKAVNKALEKAGAGKLEMSPEQKAEIAEVRRALDKAEKKLDALAQDGEHFYSEAFESEAAAKRRADELGVQPRRSIEHFREANPVNRAFLDRLSESIGGQLSASQAAGVREAMAQVFLSSLPDVSALKSQLKRRKVQGFEKDMLRSYSASAQRDAHYLSRLEFMDEMNSLLYQMDAARKELGTKDGDDLFNEIQRRHVASMNYVKTPVQDALSAVAFVWQLGVSPAFLLTNMTQPFMVSLPFMAGRHRLKAGPALAKGMADIGKLANTRTKEGKFTFEVDINKLTDAGELAALQRAQDNGLLTLTLEADIGAYASDSVTPISRASRLISSFPHNVEVINRTATALAAYRLEFDRTNGNQKAAEDYALKVLDKTHFDYSSVNAPYYLKPGALPLNKLLFQYRKYQIGVVSLLANQAKQALKGATPQERAEARAALVGLFTMHGLFAGAMGIPLVGTAMFVANLIGQAFGDEDEPFDAEVSFRNWLADALGVEAGAVVAKGLPMLAGIDLSQRIGLGEIAHPIRVLRDDKEGRDFYAEVLMAISGPTIGGLFPKWADGFKFMANGDIMRAGESFTPKFLGDTIKAARIAQDGITTQTGNVSIKSEDISAWDTFATAMGVPTAVSTERNAAVAAVGRARDEIRSRRKEITDQWVEARRKGDSEGMAAAIAARDRYNARRLENGEKPLLMRDMLASYKAKVQNEKNLGPGGVSLPKAERAIGERARFAATP